MIKYPKRYDDDFLNTFKKVIDVINTRGESLLDDEFFAEWINENYQPKMMGEWDNSREYEGLSIVTYKGASYTSNKRVPVGIDIDNEEFWVLTGNYNSQIEYYRQDVERLSEGFDTLKSDINDDISDFKENVNSDILNYKSDMDKKVSDFRSETDDKIFNVNENIRERSISRGYDVKLDLNIDTTGSTDVSEIFKNALTPNTSYFFPEGEYLFESRVEIPDNVKITGDKAVINGGGFILKGGNTTVDGMIFKGHRNEGIEADVGIRMDSPINNTLINNTFDHSRLYFNDFHIDNLQGNVKIINNSIVGDYGIFTGTSRPITIHSMDGLFINGNYFDCRCPGSSIIKLQGRYETASNGKTYVGDKYTKNVVFTNNVFKGTGSSCISLYNGAGEIVISDNIFNFGTKNEPAFRVIDGKNDGTDVLTNKIRNIVFNGNVYEGYYTSGYIRLQGAYGFEEEGDDQVGIISNNTITNYHENQTAYPHIEIGGYHQGIIKSNIINHFTGGNYNSAIAVGGVKTSDISNNVIKEGTILISNTTVTTSGDEFTGKIERVNISNNTIERYLTAAVYIRDVNNSDVDIIINGNMFHSDKPAPGQPNVVIARQTPNIRTLIMNGNIGTNKNSAPGSRPDLRDPVIEQLIENGNTWESSILS